MDNIVSIFTSTALVFLGLFLLSLPVVLASPPLTPASWREAGQYATVLFLLSITLVLLSA
jgi:hypothetical protein